MDRRVYLRKRYGRSQALVNFREQQLVRAFLERAGPSQRIFDLPCGFGRFTHKLRQAAGRELVCGDLDEERLRELRADEPLAGTPLGIIRADLDGKLPFDDDAFDLVFNFRFFQHVRDAERRLHVAGELVRVAAKHLIVSYYHPAPLHRTYKRFRGHPKHALDLALLPKQSFRLLFEALGCCVLADRAVLPFVHANRIALLRKSGSGRLESTGGESK